MKAWRFALITIALIGGITFSPDARKVVTENPLVATLVLFIAGALDAAELNT